MSYFIAGAGWLTPLGGGLAEVWPRLCNGEEAAAEAISDPIARQPYQVFRVPEAALSNLPRHPRLRRASAISRFAAAAGLAALEDARATLGELLMSRTALIFAVANGGVIYTKRFFHDVVAAGAQSASPLLFPETVFNAPASHLAAILGIEGATYTLVGDGAVGIAAMKMAGDLLDTGTIDHCLVVGAEEADWLLCDAYHKWRLLRSAPPIEPFRQPPRGMILSEGAGAVLISRAGEIAIEANNAGTYFSSRARMTQALTKVACDLSISQGVAAVIGSANGTFIDQAEAVAVAAAFPNRQIYSVKPALGESVGASAIWQVIVAIQTLKTKRLPPLLHAESAPAGTSVDLSLPQHAVVLSVGLNQQVAGLRLSI